MKITFKFSNYLRLLSKNEAISPKGKIFQSIERISSNESKYLI